MLFQVLSPFTMSVNADSFKDAIKQVVVNQRNLDITRLIMADRFNNRMHADIAYTLKDGKYVAGISLTPTTFTNIYNMMTPAVVTNNKNTPYPLSPMLNVLRPAVLTKDTTDGRQVFPLNNNNLAVGGIKAPVVGMAGLVPASPMFSPTPGFFLNNKNMKQ